MLITRSSSAATWVSPALATDTTKHAKEKKKKKPPLDAKVDYSARDSIRLDAKKRKVYLYGDAVVKYQDLTLKAGYIDILLDSNIAYAVGVHDSGKIIGRPEFQQGSEVFHADEMRYNFKTKKGRINEIDTKEGEGYIHGNKVKKDSTNTYYIKNGRYTTCSDEKDPHFFIAAYKLKVMPGDQVVTGPAMLYIEGVPTPLVIPFGFFPLSSGRHSGILIPTYGESASQGFFLQNGGYYLGLNDHFGTQLRGDIYTNGSWGLRDLTNYDDRYHYHGSFLLSLSQMIQPITETSNNTSLHSFLINWQHQQDPKARPNSTFMASVNAGSTDFLQLNSYNPSQILQNTMQSNISFTQNFPQTPFHLSLNAEHSENTINQTITINLPEVTASMDRQYPAKWFEDNTKPLTNADKFLNNISLGATVNASNEISTTEALLFRPKTLQQMENGVSTSVPVSANWQIFKYVTITPSFAWNPVTYFQTIREKNLNGKDSIVADTVQGAQTDAAVYNAAVALSTNLYGMYGLGTGAKKPILIRQVFYLSLSFSYHPDYSSDIYGYYKSVEENVNGVVTNQQYSIFQNGIYGGPQPGKSELIGFSIGTNLEMKVRTRTDSGIIYKKMKLLERFGITTAYNAGATTNPWSAISMAGNTTILKKLAVNFSGAVDPYFVNNEGQDINQIFWGTPYGVGRFTNGELSFSTTITSGSNKSGQNKTQNQNAGNANGNDYVSDMNTTGSTTNNNNNNQQNIAPSLKFESPNDYFEYEQMHAEYWTPLEIAPWSLTAFYNLVYSHVGLQPSTITQTVMFNGSMQLSKYWYFSFNSGYDLRANQFTQTLLSAKRDMHCWELMFTTVPFGYHQMFSLTVHVKASVLQDLKLQRQRDWTDTQQYGQ